MSAWGSSLGFWRGGGRTFTSVIAVGHLFLAPVMSDPIVLRSRSFYLTELVIACESCGQGRSDEYVKRPMARLVPRKAGSSCFLHNRQTIFRPTSQSVC